MTFDSAAFAQQYVASMNVEQLQRFQERWTQLSRKQNEAIARMLEQSSAMDGFRKVQKQLRVNIDEIVRQSGVLETLNKRVAEINASIPLPKIELPQDIRDNIQRLAGFEAQFGDVVTLGRYGTAVLEDPDADEFRASVDEAFSQRQDLLETIHSITVSEAIEKVLPRESIQFGVKCIVFLVWVVISLFIAGGTGPATLLLESIGFGSLITGLAFADYVGKKVVPIPPKPESTGGV